MSLYEAHLRISADHPAIGRKSDGSTGDEALSLNAKMSNLGPNPKTYPSKWAQSRRTK